MGYRHQYFDDSSMDHHRWDFAQRNDLWDDILPPMGTASAMSLGTIVKASHAGLF